MGFPFISSLHALIETIGQPIHDRLPFPAPGVSEEHLLLWECYLSGQMPAAALAREMTADPQFADFVNRKAFSAH